MAKAKYHTINHSPLSRDYEPTVPVNMKLQDQLDVMGSTQLIAIILGIFMLGVVAGMCMMVNYHTGF